MDRWYCYTATCTGTATADTCGAANFDTTISVYDACDGVSLACNDDAPGCVVTSRVSWPVVGGVDYLVRVAGFNGSVGSYTLTIGCEPGAAANDACAEALPIVDGVIPFDTTGATTDGPGHEACLAFGDLQVNQDIWYTYVAACPGELTVSTCGTADFDTRLAVYEGTACPSTDERLLACNDDGLGCPDFTSQLSVPVEEGTSYLIRVGGFGTNTGTGTLLVSCVIPGGPENNTCSNALPIEGASVAFDTTEATTSGLPLFNCTSFVDDDQIYKDVWFTYDASCTGQLFVDTCGSADFDTRIAVYQTTICPQFSSALLACNDDGDGCVDGTSSLVVTVAEGERYTIRVGGTGPEEGGVGTLHVSLSPLMVLDVESDPNGFGVGESVLVQLRMANLCGAEAAGFQAFVEFDEATLAFASGAYETEPFGLPIVTPIVATDGVIDLAAGLDKGAGQVPSSADAVLATLEFTSLVSQCGAEVRLRPGVPPTQLTDSTGAPIEPLQLIDGASCAGDVNGDGGVDVDDLVAVILAWGTVSCDGDANDDGSINVDDLITVIINWGPCPDL